MYYWNIKTTPSKPACWFEQNLIILPWLKHCKHKSKQYELTSYGWFYELCIFSSSLVSYLCNFLFDFVVICLRWKQILLVILERISRSPMGRNDLKTNLVCGRNYLKTNLAWAHCGVWACVCEMIRRALGREMCPMSVFGYRKFKLYKYAEGGI